MRSGLAVVLLDGDARVLGERLLELGDARLEFLLVQLAFCRSASVFDRFKPLHARVRLKVAHRNGAWDAGRFLALFVESILTKTRIK